MFRRALAAFAALSLTASLASAEQVDCQKQIIKNLEKFKKTHLNYWRKCIEKENVGKIPGPCLDTTSATKLSAAKEKIKLKLDAKCTPSDLTALGFTTCAFETTPTGVESACAALPVGTGGQFADCLMCWKGAELSEFLATVYASHASEVCNGAYDETSTACSELDCASPLPTQRDLGITGENDCQKAVGKASIKLLLQVEKTLEKCGLAGNSRTSCLGDSVIAEKISVYKDKMEVQIKNKCGNRDPEPAPPYCCKTAGNACVLSADRDDCTTNLGGTVQEGKTCDMGSCANAGGGGQVITWWSTCPKNDTCTGTLDTDSEMISCLQDTVDEIVHELTCIQFASGWGPCPADAP